MNHRTSLYPVPEARKPKNEVVRKLYRGRPLEADPTKTVFTCTGCNEGERPSKVLPTQKIEMEEAS